MSDVAGHLNSQHARLVRLTAQAITSGEWFGVGIHTPVQWLTIQVGLSSGRAKQIVAIAKRVDEFPLMISLCPQHHRLHHKGLLRIDGNADIPGRMTFADARGSPLVEHPNPVSPNGPPPEPAARYEHPTGERLQPRWIDWSHPNARKRRREQSDLRPHHDANQS